MGVIMLIRPNEQAAVASLWRALAQQRKTS
jgi:hypothetical protein